MKNSFWEKIKINEEIENFKNKNKILILILFLSIFTFTLTPLTSAFNWNNNISSYYKLDEASGSFIYDATGLNNGSINNGVLINQSGKINTSYLFDGVNDYTRTNPILSNSNYSISFWIYSYGQVGTILMTGNGSENQKIYETGGNLVPYFDNNLTPTYNMTIPLTNATWTHIAITVGYGDKIRTYKNGVSIQNQSIGSTFGNHNIFDLGRDINNIQYWKGKLDEIGLWNRSLTASEITELYNSGNGTAYGETTTQSINLTINSPNTNYQLLTSNFSVNYTINNSQNLTIYNSTLYILNSNQQIIQSTTLNLSSTNTSINQNITANISSYGLYSYYIITKYNSSGNITNASSETRTFFNAIQINILDKYNNSITDGKAIISGLEYNTNPIIYPSSIFSTNNTTSLNVYAYSQGGAYKTNNTTLTINISSQTIYNITLQNYKLNLYFTRNGTTANVSGYITDNTTSITFTNTTYLNDQNNFQPILVYARFVNSSIGGNVTWNNKTQFYEYDNSIPYDINETIEIFSSIDTSSYFQTQDNSNNIIKQTKLRLYGVLPSNQLSGTKNYSFYGQRITDYNGRSVFPLNSEMEFYIVATADGYQTTTAKLTASEITTFTDTNPYVIRMNKATYSGKNNIFIGGLYKLDGNYIKESPFDDISKNYYLFVSDDYDRNLQYQTSFEGINRTITLDDTTHQGIISLISGQQFNNNANNSFYLYIFSNNNLTYNISINFQTFNTTTIIDTENLNLQNKLSWRVLIFAFLIIICFLLSALIETAERDIGLHTFMIGSIFLPIATNGLGWMAFIGATFYLGKGVKKWIAE